MSVMTVTGRVSADTLGIVAPHEHVFIDMRVFFHDPEEISAKADAQKPVGMELLGALRRNPYAVRDNLRLTDRDVQIRELSAFRKAGGATVVDATTIGLGRDPDLLRDVSVETGLQIVAGAGFYVQDAVLAGYLEMSAEELETHIVREIEQGIGHGDIRAGIIGEIGVSYVMRPFERRCLTAACRAQRRTGAPLMIHINPWSTGGLDALDVIRQESVPPGKVVICHADVQNRTDYIQRLLDAGVYVEFDNFGKEMFIDRWNIKPDAGRFVTDWERVLLIKALTDRGYGNQLLFSCDVCLKTLLHAYGGWGYDHVLTHVVPMLDEAGVSRETVDRILTKNPALWLDS